MDFPLRGRLADLVARARAGRLVSTPWPGGTWMFLNVRQPPFDDPRVRRAVNYAVDRAKLIELYGGPQAADPTCQIVSPGLPGYSPYCPYTADPAARRRVDRAGPRPRATPGRRVGPRRRERDRPRRRGGAPAAGPYFVSLLRDLGFHARMHVVPSNRDYFAEILRRDSRGQMGWFGWAPDYMSASTLLDPTFGCTARGDPNLHNASRVCDARLDAALDRARAAAPDDAPAAWAAVDRRIVDLAAALPYVNQRFLIFVSKRVGNVTFHPMYQTLLDQIWVR